MGNTVRWATAPYGELMVFLPDSIHHEGEFLVFRSFETQVYTRFRSLRLSDNVTRANMPIPYDIFKKDSHGVPVWVEAAPDLETAQLRVVELDKQKPGDYMIFCYMTQELISAAPRTA